MFGMIFGSIVGGLISSRAQKKAQKREMAYQDKVRREAYARDDTKIQRMAKDARAAGLNPVSALRSGAFHSSGFQAPVLSSFANADGGLGGAVARAFSFMDTPTKQQKRREALELQLLDAQIRNTNQRTDYYSGLGQTPQAALTEYGKGGAPQLSSWVGNSSQVGALPSIDATPDGRYHRPVDVRPEAQIPLSQQVTFGDQTFWGPNPEAFETGFGELLAGGFIYGSQFGARYVQSSLEWRKISEQERQQQEKSWYPAWAPRISYSGFKW